ncbi:MAG: hypothetical protein HY282_02335 [Nitrospirae bacterium]|nr:hypothetical protein [Candidatus Manganitrophaceae bacterium]
MAGAYLLREEDKVALKAWVGEIRKEELFALDRAFLSNPDLPPAPRVLVDVTRASFHTMGENDFQELVNLYWEYREKSAGAKVAIISRQDFQKAKLYEKRAASVSINAIVFNEVAHACTWLGVNAREVQAWLTAKRAELLSASLPEKDSMNGSD